MTRPADSSLFHFKVPGLGEKTYSAKEIAIFDAVARLMNQGHKPYELKISQIAAAAGIGKGTAYEYFPSKNELMIQAMHYHVLLEFQQLVKILDGTADFQTHFQQLLDFSAEMMQSRLPNLWALIQTLDHDDLAAFELTAEPSLSQIVYQSEELIEQLMQRGIAEQQISRQTSREYRLFVLNGVISAYINQWHRSRQLLACPTPTRSSPDETMQAKSSWMEQAWTMLIKALN